MDTHTLEHELGKLGRWERRALEAVLHRRTIARNTNEVFQQQLTLGERVADRVAALGGSWKFILLFLGFMSLWLLYNGEAARSFDPYPFILLNLVLSCLAAIQAPVIMMSQNRQAAKDRLDAQHDYEINLKAELEITALQARLDDLRGEHVFELRQLVEKQTEILRRLEQRLGLAEGTRGED
ncbi:MAG: DUF1003 domain-containing protein [Bryobacteraceae bacterium]